MTYEYRVYAPVVSLEEVEAVLNEYGRAGWRVHSVTVNRAFKVFLLERQNGAGQ